MYLPKGPVYKYNECVALKLKINVKRLESPGVKPMPKYVTIPGGIRSFRRSFGLGGGKIIEKNNKQTGGVYGFVSRTLNLGDRKIPLPQYVTYKLDDEYDS